MSKQAPVTWKVGPYGGIYADGMCILTGTFKDGSSRRGRRENETLAAAAPDMLAALEDAKRLLDALRIESGVGEILDESQRDLFSDVDDGIIAAIAKAKGSDNAPAPTD